MKLSREMVIQNRYVNMPVKNGAPMRRMRFRVGGRTVREFDIELAEGEVDFWVFSDVSMFQGERLTIEVDELDAGSAALKSITQDDAITGAENLYRERLRPQLHFSSRRGWNNDPNGLVYYKGEYHMFYQHNPYGWKWGNMHWGHATSADLIHWEELPEALYPDKLGTMFSGSGLVDWENTSGLKAGNEDTLLLVYTAAGGRVEPKVPYTQCLAFSNDRGETWHKYAGNPVLPHIAGGNRDPKPIWHQRSGQWIMALYIERSGENQHLYSLFASSNLREWRHLDDITLPGNGECPDFFPLSVDGDPGNEKWVFWGADGHYVIGAFDGTKFVPQTAPLLAYCGGADQRCSDYAAQTWSDIPADDGRRIQIAWLQSNLPGMSFNQQMSLPVELKLGTTANGIRLLMLPVEEIDKLRAEKRTLRDADLSMGPVLLPIEGCDLLDIRAEIQVLEAAEIEFTIRGIPVLYDVQRQELSCCDRTAPLAAPGGNLQLRVLLDRASIEIFAAGGQVYIPLGVIPEDDARTCALSCRGGKSVATLVDVFTLHSIWG